MPFSNFQVVETFRDRLVTLLVVPAPVVDIEVVEGNPNDTYVRASGSWTDDGFYPGMEVDASGFADSANNGLSVVKVATDLVLTVDEDLSNEASASGRSISVGLPSRIAPENVEFTPDEGKPYVEESFIPGPTTQETVGPGGDIEADPLYVVRLFVPADYGPESLHLYGDALVALFASRTAMSLTNGDVLRVRTNPGPFRGQLLQLKPGWATVPVTIPLRIRTINP